MDFSLSEYVRRGFADVAVELTRRGVDELQRATDTACGERFLEQSRDADGVPSVWLDAMRIGPSRSAVARVQWWTSPGAVVVDGVIRVLPVEDGRDEPMSELLLQGSWQTVPARLLYPLEWSRRILELTTDALHQGPRSVVTLPESDSTASRPANHLLLAELSHPGD